MKYAILDESRIIVNTIEAEPDIASEIGAHYLGDVNLGIGNQYPDKEITPEPTIDERVTTLETEVSDISTAIERGLSI